MWCLLATTKLTAGHLHSSGIPRMKDKPILNNWGSFPFAHIFTQNLRLNINHIYTIIIIYFVKLCYFVIVVYLFGFPANWHVSESQALNGTTRLLIDQTVGVYLSIFLPKISPCLPCTACTTVPDDNERE